jgi:50S ribosomal protein L16 3-hydroxylase
MTPLMPTRNLLGGIAPREFLARYWQKRPLLVRGAWPDFREPVTPSELLRLAARDDCESRMVFRAGSRWRLEHGPFERARLRGFAPKRWTVLVQGLNHFVPAADQMLRAFRFINYARLDDVMASFATPGGGVGPHFDSYDVFLVQGRGRRRWRLSRQRDLALDTQAPLKVLRNFRPSIEWTLESGDMLYLPPGIAHEGVAIEPCITYSVGFRAPSGRELADGFLAFLQDRGRWSDERFRDRDASAARRPARVSDALLDHCVKMIDRVHWSRNDIEEFVGRHLSEPKPYVRFVAPPRPLSRGAFRVACARRGVRLALATGMLFRRNRIYLNGESVAIAGRTRTLLTRLADERELEPGAFTRAANELLYTWYRAGYLALGDHRKDGQTAT